jgi:hypothetical protein
MVIHNFNLEGVARTPNEADPPLVIDSNRMLTLPVASQRLQMIPGRGSQNV